MAPTREAHSIFNIIAPTDGTKAAKTLLCQDVTGDFGGSPIFEQPSGKPLLATTEHLGYRGAKRNGGRRH